MKRGDVVTAVMPREQGKPRPAVVVQADDLEGSTTLLVCPLTSRLEFRAPHRPELEPGPDNGLRKVSLVMIDKIQATGRDRCDQVVGHLNNAEMALVEAGLAYVLGLRRA
jgi:mRNA interferase MazF